MNSLEILFDIAVLICVAMILRLKFLEKDIKRIILGINFASYIIAVLLILTEKATNWKHVFVAAIIYLAGLLYLEFDKKQR